MREITSELKEESRRLHATIAECAETLYKCAQRLGRDVTVEINLMTKNLTIEYDRRRI